MSLRPGEALLSGLAGAAEDRRDGTPRMTGPARRGDSMTQMGVGLVAGVAGGGDLQQGMRVGQGRRLGALAESGTPPVAGLAEGKLPVTDGGEDLAAGAGARVAARPGQPRRQQALDTRRVLAGGRHDRPPTA